MGFSLSSGGDAVYLTDPSETRILDAVVVPASSTGVPFVRPRSDAPLRSQSQPSIVINELMFHPPTHDDADEWIEIHNAGLLTRDLSGWTFTDGIDFVIPNGTQILAGGFLVIAKDRART